MGPQSTAIKEKFYFYSNPPLPARTSWRLSRASVGPLPVYDYEVYVLVDDVMFPDPAPVVGVQGLQPVSAHQEGGVAIVGHSSEVESIRLLVPRIAAY